MDRPNITHGNSVQSQISTQSTLKSDNSVAHCDTLAGPTLARRLHATMGPGHFASPRAGDARNPDTPPRRVAAELAEVLLESLDKGQARMEQELGAIRSDLAHLQELLWRLGNSEKSKTAVPRSQWWQVTELLSGSVDRHPAVPSEAWATFPARQHVPVATKGLFPAVRAKAALRAQVPKSEEATERPLLAEGYERESRGSSPHPHPLFGQDSTQLPPSLPASWPGCLEGRDVAVGGMDVKVQHSLPGAELRYQKTSNLGPSESPDQSPCYMLDPNSNLCKALAATTVLMLCQDMFMIPFVLAWELPLEGIVLVLTWISCFYWTIDMGVSFITGYHKGHEIEMRIWYVARRYVTSWFVPDFVVLCTDWLGILLTVGGHSEQQGLGSMSKLLRVAKLGKLVRLLGLLRMTRAAQAFEEVIENSLSDQTRLGLRLVQFLLGICWLCHLIGCGWFAVGRAPSDTGMRWTDTFMSQGMIDLAFLEAGKIYQYVTALHWSLAQFSLGAIEITCYNSWERIFNMACIFVGLICGSVIVGTFSATMMEYQMVVKDNAQKLSQLRRYLRENRRFISKSTALQVQQQAAERLKVKEKLQERDVPVLELVSATLRSKLRYEIFVPILNTHGLFQMWAILDKTTMRRACGEVMQYNHYGPQDELFLAGVITDRVVHIAAGDVVYIKDPETAPVIEQEIFDVSAGTWLGEAGLWSQWIHVGTAKTVNHCDILTVTAGAVDMIVEHQPQLSSITRHYARQFLKCIQSSGPPSTPFPDDLEVPHTQFDEILVSCQPAVQRAVSLTLLQHFDPRPEAFRELKEEIRQGKCCVVLTKEGKIQRMVSVVVLNLYDDEGNVMVEVAKMEAPDGGQRRFLPSCQLPAKKQAQGEVSLDTLRRMLEKLKFSSDSRSSLEMRGLERQVQRKHSEQFGVETRYMRKVYTAVTRDSSIFGTPFHCPPEDDLETPDSNVDVQALSNSSMATRSRNMQKARSSASGAPAHQPKEELSLDRVPVCIDQDKRSLLAWLPTHTFERLSSPAGKQTLASWVEMLNEVEGPANL